MTLYARFAGTALICMLALHAALPAQAEEAVSGKDEILLKNGSRLVGDVVDSRDGLVKIKTDFAGTLSVKLDQIVSVSTEASVVVLMADETVVKDNSLTIKENELVLDTTGLSCPLEQMSVVNPQPWELGLGYRWTGVLGAALVRQRGNTDTDELDYKVDSLWRSTRDRYTFGPMDKPMSPTA